MIAAFASAGALFSLLAASPNGNSIHVSGAVKKPGAFIAAKAQPLSAALKEMGGLRADADTRQIRITAEDGTARIVDVGKLGTIPMVQPGEVVEVPAIDFTKNVVVRGGVSNPGPFEFKEGMSILDVLKSAEPSALANLKSVKVARQSESGKVEIINANLLAMSTGKTAPMALRPGDTVAVPFGGNQMSDRDLLMVVLIVLLVVIIAK